MSKIRSAPAGAAASFNDGDSIPMSRSPYNDPATTNFYLTRAVMKAYFDSLYLTPAEGDAAYQPLDADLTAIAALATDAFGRSVLTQATAAALATLAGVGTGDSPQFTAVNIGHATDTTITRVSAGVIAVEGKTVPDDAAVVHDTGDETIAGVKTFSSDPLIPDEVYGVGWNGSLEPPTKNAVYDKIETISSSGEGWTLDVDVGGTADAAIAAAVNTMYVRDISGFSADRTLTLPTTAAVGDRVGLMIETGDATYELLITAAASDTLNGVAGGTEWSRLFITGEVVIMRCVEANTTWVVEQDGRIPCKVFLRLSTAPTANETAGTYQYPTAVSPTPGAWTADQDVGNCAVVASDKIVARRAATWSFEGSYRGGNAISAGKYTGFAFEKNDTVRVGYVPVTYTTAASFPAYGGHVKIPQAVDDYIRYQYRSEEGSRGLTSSSTEFTASVLFSGVEIFP